MIQIYKYMNDRDMRMINVYHRVCNQNNTTGVTSETGTIYPSGAPKFSPDVWWESFVLLDHQFSVQCFVDRCFRSSCFVWPLCCLSFFDLRILITSLVSTNSSYNNVQLIHLNFQAHYSDLLSLRVFHDGNVDKTELIVSL